MLLERDDERAALQTAIEAGRIAVVTGEAGIGKTELVRAVAPPDALWGACDPLITPRPMGPWHDIARRVPPLAEALAGGSREAVLSATLDELERSTLVIEDLHWADDATLDLVALVGRRVARGSLILTTRPAARPEVRRVLAALRASRVEPGPLSAGAVASLAARAGREPGDLHAVTGGNPFFVAEALAGREAIALRLGALSDPARTVVELASVVPGTVELWLIDEGAGAIDECVAAGLVQVRGDALAFRHDLARRAVQDSISPARRRELDRRVLTTLERFGSDDPARLAHHARRAGDWEAIRRLAPPAARSAAAAGGHRQALEHWEAALAVGADALEGVSTEAYFCGHMERAIEARRALVDQDAPPLKHGEHLRWLSRLLWWSGRGEEAVEVGDRAIAALEAFPGSRELAMALSARSQLAMLAQHNAEAISLGSRAAALADSLGDEETAIHALTNVATAELNLGDVEGGRLRLDEAHARAAAAGFPDHAARALVNLTTGTMSANRADPRVAGDLERALAYSREHQLDGYTQYMLGVRGFTRLLGGAWGPAEEDARAALALGDQPGVSLCPAKIVLGRLQSRRGDAEAGATLDVAWKLAVKTGEIQRLAPAAAARAEHAWLGDELRADDATPADAATAPLSVDMSPVAALWASYALADERGDAWGRAELAFWLRRAGADVAAHADDPVPFALAASGDWAGAAAAWRAAGLPYEAADALAQTDARVDALVAFDELGATRVAQRLRRRLRAEGVRRIPRGPRPASRAAPGGLTPRECEVYAHLIEGATNAEIAEALVISPKTVDHHVSAVLGKLGASSRRELKGARPF